MKVAIIGGGAIGLLFASYLSKKHEVTIYTRTKEQAKMLQEKGLSLINQQDETQIIKLSSFPMDQMNQVDSDIVIVAVKQYHLNDLMDHLKSIRNSSLLFLQNGMSHLSYLDTLPAESIFVGVVEHGAQRIDPITVKHTGLGVTRFGLWKGGLSFEEEELSEEGFPFVLQANPTLMLKEKLLVNCVINPLTALLQVPNGQLVDNPYYYQLFQVVFEEGVHALHMSSKEQLFNKVEQICRKTAQNHSSMFKDLQVGRKTEIEAIVGSVLEEAKKNKSRVPTLEFLYNAIKGKEV
ncbi:2-dehydropantoate 2-reductase [Bacillus carboniphilus]|uniref:2-dehydropantoate 2-reductase n=1 Tax=Bacillus carboniphilus TaxID=86663 RepID=A0ABP3FZH4_9BACI